MFSNIFESQRVGERRHGSTT